MGRAVRGREPLAWFGCHQGSIEVRNPDGCTIQKMAQVAEELNANVVDENDNLLVDPGRPDGDTDDGAWRAASPAFQLPEPWPSWGPRTGAAIFGAFVYAGLAFVVGGLGLIFFLLLRDWWER